MSGELALKALDRKRGSLVAGRPDVMGWSHKPISPCRARERSIWAWRPRSVRLWANKAWDFGQKACASKAALARRSGGDSIGFGRIGSGPPILTPSEPAPSRPQASPAAPQAPGMQLTLCRKKRLANRAGFHPQRGRLLLYFCLTDQDLQTDTIDDAVTFGSAVQGSGAA